MEPRIKILEDKKLIGTRLKMSLEMDKTAQLWGGFIPRIKEIKKRFRTDKISVQIYNSSYFTSFDAVNVFEKWASVEVIDFKEVPEEMEVFILKGGEYAVFDYKGASNDSRVFQYIFMTWLPASGYQLDDRPHFEVLGEKYKNNDPNSEEEIWIPIKKIN